MMIFSCDQNCELHKIVEIVKEAMGFPVVCILVAEEFT